MNLLRASRFPAPHGFSTRDGGVSQGVFRSLNLGWNVGDGVVEVAENFERLAAGAPFPLRRLHTLSQVHGAQVVEVGGDALRPAQPEAEADCLWTRDAGAVVGVKTADCIPLLLAAPGVKAVAAVHSGWRGTAASIAARAVEALVAKGAEPSGIFAAVGPCIRRCCYEVSPELAGRFRGQFGEAVVEPAHGDQGPHLDLVACLRRTLKAAGVPEAQVEDLEACTACDAERFYSHRRDAPISGTKGLHLSFVECRFS